MTEIEGEIIGGVDAHTDTHVASVDRRGQLLGTETFQTTPAGNRALRGWLEQFGPIAVVGVESTGAYAAGLVRELRAAGIRVAEVNRRHARTRRRRGKNDPIDAEQAARHALSGATHVEPKATDGIVEAIRQLRLARDSAVKARSAALCQLSEMTITAPDDLRQQLRTGNDQGPRHALPAPAPRHQPSARARASRQARTALDRPPDRRTRPRDRPTRPRVRTAGRDRSAAHHEPAGRLDRPRRPAGDHRRPNIDRLHSDSAFATLCGASPIPASSGRTTRHRLNYGGDRDTNRALHMIAVCRLRYCTRTRVYAERRTAGGKTKPEIIRCLKRYIAREIYHHLHADLAALTHP
jgi:transposase